MNIQGTLEYAPITLAGPRDRLRLIRRNAQFYYALLLGVHPFLSGKTVKQITVLKNKIGDDIHYWIRSTTPEEDLVTLGRLIEVVYKMLNEQPTERQPALVNTFFAAAESFIQDLQLTDDASNWAILKINPKLIESFTKELFAKKIRLSKSLWGCHCTVIREEAFEGRPHEGTVFNITVIPEIESNAQGYYWLPVIAPELEILRNSLGLSARPTPGFHITLGKKI